MYIAILEDDERRQTVMRHIFATYYPALEPAFFDNAPDMNAWLARHLSNVALVCLDHDLGPNRDRDGEVFDPGIGRHVADYLASCAPICPVVIHTTNSQAAPGMESVLQEAGWQVGRVVPFDDLEWIDQIWRNEVERCLTTIASLGRPAQSPVAWEIWRQDDNGNQFFMDVAPSRQAAQALIHEFEARGHKQHYFFRPRADLQPE